MFLAILMSFNSSAGSVQMFKIEPAHEIMVLITQATSEGSGDPANFAQSCQSLRCSHTWSMEADKGSDQKSDIYPHWMAVPAHLKNEFTEEEKFHNLMWWLNYKVLTTHRAIRLYGCAGWSRSLLKTHFKLCCSRSFLKKNNICILTQVCWMC